MATLKISDLSVGDWVITKDGNVTVDIISPLEVVVMNDYGNLCACKIEDIEPIPITAEILEKNGFESTTKPNVFTLTHGKLQLYVSNELDGWHMSFVNFMERLCILQVIRKSNIHELQHALRLAGVEKEINL